MKLTSIAMTTLFASLLPLAAQAEQPAAEQVYRHALGELHAARKHVQHRPGETALTSQESSTLTEIDRAVGEVQKAAHEEWKGQDSTLREDPNIDLDRPSRLHRAVELLEQVHGDLEQELATPEAGEYKRRALNHIDRAIAAARVSIREAERIRDAKIER